MTLSGTVEDFAIVTSPIRRYLWLTLEQTMIFGAEDEYVKYLCWDHRDWGSFYLLEYNEGCKKFFEQRLQEMGMIPRYREVYWRRLEEDRWRRLNGIVASTEPLGVK
jgi:hypothetical protein